MKILIVYAHQEPASFNQALLDRSLTELATLGHEVQVSDLYAMNFNPVATAADFLKRRFPDRLHYDREQKFAYDNDALSDDITTELNKLMWCDGLILQFPLWWFSMPAIMKGWIDRVFINGAAYGGGRRYDTGGLKGRRAMVVTSTAAFETMAAPDGLVGALDIILWPIQNGTLAYAGCTVLPPFVAWNASFVDAATRQTYLDGYAARLHTLETTEPLFFHPLADFGDDWRLKPGIDAKSVGQSRFRF